MRWAGSSARTNFTGKATYRDLTGLFFLRMILQHGARNLSL